MEAVRQCGLTSAISEKPLKELQGFFLPDPVGYWASVVESLDLLKVKGSA